MKFLFIGDVVGKGGRRAVASLVPRLRAELGCSFCVVNGENAANGSGLSAKCVNELGDAVDVVTTGDHIWGQKNFEQEILRFKHVLRPANFSDLQPGAGWGVFRNPAAGEVAVINLLGKIFTRESAYCPFETVEKILAKIPPTVKTIVVDMHAEATSEKIAMGYFLDGKVTAVLGTHTHVATADATILPGGTAYITDVGMTGGRRSVLGRKVENVLRKFRTGMPTRLDVVEDDIILRGAVVSYDLKTGRAQAIEPVAADYAENGA